jgi:glycosyltransferase involved in cell wall biosynthesis
MDVADAPGVDRAVARIVSSVSRPQPLISVVVAVLNGAATVQRTLDSVFGQRYAAKELIVIDGASTDGTTAILDQNSARLAYWESERDRGVYHAWNKALQHVSGDWICFLGADDQLAEADVLSRLAPHLARASSIARVAYAQIRLESGGTLIGGPWDAVRPAFWRGMAIPHQATFHHTDLFAQRGNFDESFRIAGDYELLLRELVHRDPVFVPGVIAVEMGTSGLSSRPGNRVLRITEFERARRMHGLARGPVALAPAVIRARAREFVRRLFGSGAEATANSLYRRLRRGSTR